MAQDEEVFAAGGIKICSAKLSGSYNGETKNKYEEANREERDFTDEISEVVLCRI